MLLELAQSTWTALTGPFGAILLIVVAAWGLAMRSAGFHGRKAEITGALLLLFAGGLDIAIGTRVALHHSPMFSADLATVGASVRVPPLPPPLSLALSVQLPEVEQGQALAVRYTVSVLDGKREVDRHRGQLDQRWRRTGVARGLRVPVPLVHAGERVGLPSTEGPLVIRLERLEEEASVPLHVDVVPGPPSMQTIGFAVGLLVLGGALVDAWERKRTAVSIYAGFLGVVAIALLRGITPSSPGIAVGGPVLMGLFVGTSFGWWTREILTWGIGWTHVDDNDE